MAIISVSMLENELSDDAENNNKEMTRAVNSASGFVNSFTSKKHDIWDDYDTDDDIPRAPDIIVAYCLRVSKMYYKEAIGEVWRDGGENETIRTVLDDIKKELVELAVPPEFKTQAVSLDSNSSMIVGSRTTTSGQWTRVIPFNAHITTGVSSVYVINDDFWIDKGGYYTDEYPEAWYLRTNSGSSVEGTLSYMRTYRKDSADYIAYMR